MPRELPTTIDVVDSHTEGEPTRVVVDGWPQPAGASMADRRAALRRNQDVLRRSVVLEPRGHEAVVGALLTPPVSAEAAAGVIFFNNVDCLWMCGHGLIGVVRTLAFLGRLSGDRVVVDTPVGPVSAALGEGGAVTIENVPARCAALDVAVEVPGLGTVVGDVAWGGNWFFLVRRMVDPPPLELAATSRLVEICEAIMAALRTAGIRGEGGGEDSGGEDSGEIDHVEIFGPPVDATCDSRNFVLCPGGAYDRSPCGTGTSAKMATLHARGELAPGQRWRQEGIAGGRFVGWLEARGEEHVPHIEGRAFVTSRATLHFQPDDPFRNGFGGR